MSLTEVIRSQLKVAIKEQNELKKGILRVVLGDLSTSESRSGKKISDEDVKRIIRKIIEGNTETLKFLSTDHLSHAKLTEENHILNSLLPKSLSRQGIRQALLQLEADIKAARNDGMATGLAIKFFRQNLVEVEGTDVSAVVKDMRQFIE